MSFLNPLGLLFLGLLPVLVLLYLHRIRRKSAVVSTLLFWERAMGQQRQRFWLGKLRNLISLLLFLLILLLLVLALAKPELGAFSRGASSTVLVIDTRARMQALESNGQTRFAQATQQAKAFTKRAREGAEVAVLATNPTPKVISAFSDEATALTQKIEALSPSDASIDPAATLELARHLASARAGTGRVVFITDFFEQSPTASASEVENATGPKVEVLTVASKEPLDNVAITRFAARPQISSPETADLLLEVTNFGRSPVQGEVEIACDGVVLDVQPFDLAPGKRAANVFQALPRAGSGLLLARLHLKSADFKDALALDNTAYATFPTVKPLRVLLVTRGNWFVEKLLAADKSLRFDLLEPDSFRPEMAAQFDAVIYDEGGPSNFEELTAMRGNALFIGNSPLGTSGTLSQPLVTETDTSSPLLRFVDWDEVTLLRAHRITALEDTVKTQASTEGANWKFAAPVRSFEHPLLITGTRQSLSQTGGENGNSKPQPAHSQRLAVFAFDLAASDLPLRLAFPLLMSNTLRWLGTATESYSGDAIAGESVPLAEGEKAKLTSTENFAVTPFQPVKNGFYEIHQTLGTSPANSQNMTGAVRWVAVNTFSEADANLNPATSSKEAPSTETSTSFSAGFFTVPLWQWLAVLAFVLLLTEWWLFNRRQTE